MPVVLPTQAVLDKLLDAVVTRIRALGLTEFAAVERVKTFNSINMSFPRLVVMTDPDSDSTNRGTLLTDYVTYGVEVAVIGRDKYLPDDGELLLWAEVIARAFRRQKVTTVPECIVCTGADRIATGSQPVEGQTGVYETGIVALRFLCEETRIEV